MEGLKNTSWRRSNRVNRLKMCRIYLKISLFDPFMSKPVTQASGWSDRMATEITVLLGITTLLPYFVHLLPAWDDAPIGARLLPIFYAPLVAALSERPRYSVALAFIAPWVNHFLVGMPTAPVAMILTFELLMFSVILHLLLHNFRKAAWMGPAAYLLVKPLSGALIWLWPVVPASPWAFMVNSVSTAWPGLLVLALIGFICYQYANDR
jgi:hypothetical protein